jgi:tetratricopeptide (TPR) repeat protein
MTSTQEHASGTANTDALAKLNRLKAMLAADPQNVRLARDCVDLALRNGDYDFVLERATDVLRVVPDDAQSQFDRASALIGKKDYRAAIDALRKLLERIPTITAARINIGLCHYALGEYAQALPELQAAYVAGERPPDLLRLLVSTLHHVGLVDEAVAIADENPPPDESGAALPGAYALLYIDADQPGPAAKWAARALAVDPRSIDALIAQGTLDAASMRVASARERYGRVLELAPANGRAWVGLGTLALLDQDFARARELLTRGTQYMPNHPGSWLVLAWTHLLANELDDAERILERALEIDRNFAETHGVLASVHALRGDRAGSEREIEIAQRLDPEGLSAQFARSVLIAQAGDPAAARRLIQESLRAMAPGGPFKRMLDRAARH